MQVKMLAKDIYSQHFRAAQAVPRGVVAKLCAVVKQLEVACEKHSCQVLLRHSFLWNILLTFTFTFGVDGRSRPALRLCMFGLVHNPSMTKGQEYLLVALTNRIRVVGFTLPVSSGSMVCASI